MASCSLSPAARLEFQRRNRSILPDGGGKELSRSLKIVPRRNSNSCVARASLTISSSTSAAPIESIKPRRNPRVTRASLTISSAAVSAAPIEPRRNPCVARSSDSSMSISSSTYAAPIERIEQRRNSRVAGSSDSSMSISSSTSAAPIERIEQRRNSRVARSSYLSMSISSSTSAAPIERIEPRRNPCVARSSDLSMSISSSTSAAPIERIEPRRNSRVAGSSDSSMSISSSTSAAPIERIEPRRNPCVARSSDSSMSISSSTSVAPIGSKTALLHLTSFPDRERDRNPITAESLDVWIRDSVGEIVRHIGEAPFLLRIYSPAAASAAGGGARIEREEAATAERWPRIRERWDREGRTPEGVIQVEELRDEEADGGGGGGEKTWGLVVQGKGMDCAACYVLNTCRVRSSGGFCTHFCLVRAKCFGEAPKVQLRKAWVAGKDLGSS